MIEAYVERSPNDFLYLKLSRKNGQPVWEAEIKFNIICDIIRLQGVSPLPKMIDLTEKWGERELVATDRAEAWILGRTRYYAYREGDFQ